jgi:penicillin-binding protein 1A
MKKYFGYLIGIGIFGIAVFVYYFVNLYKNLPSGEELRNYTPVLSTKILDRNGLIVAELFTEKRTWTMYSDFPSHLKNAVISIEDHNFYNHWGINFKRIVKAFIDNMIKVRFAAGGSTITQQLARTAFLSHRKTISRKLKELALALKLENNFSKNEILEMYLNQVYLGHGAYGMAQAAKRFFAKDVSQLTLAESALLAGLIRSPNYYSPIKNFDRAIKRRNVVLQRMLELKYISPQEFESAKNEVPQILASQETSYTAPYFVEYIKEQLEPRYSDEILYQGGLVIKTTLDLKLQKYAEEILTAQLAKLTDVIKSTVDVQGALVALDVHTGGILAMVGGTDFKKTQFNRVTQALRQPGSAFKPIVYLAALENGFTPTTIIEDTPLTFVNDGIDWRLVATTTDFAKIPIENFPKKQIPTDPKKIWQPENYKHKYHGKVLLRQALELSLNSCSIRLIMEIGPSNVIECARRLGITTNLTNTFSLALGASEVYLIELTSVYNTFANNGIKTLPYGIVEIRDKFNNLLEEHHPVESIAISHEHAYLMTSLLKGVVQHGTGQYAKNLNKICAGKTGTTNDCTDAWFIGYTPDITCGVWVGFDTKKSLGKNATGGAVACPIWTEFMKLALKNVPNKDFVKPSNVVEVLVDKNTGLLASPSSKRVYTETFIQGTEPKEFSSPEISISSSTTISEPEIYDEINTGF